MIGNANLIHHPDIQTAVTELAKKKSRRALKRSKKSKKTLKSNKKSQKGKFCDPEDVELADYPQWQDERGYWIGEYTFLDGGGSPYTSSSWNYPYDHYKGFVTGKS